jgi:8-oxo-dGTP pyrophosphatase MutT (NUDIX family)
MNDDLFAFGAVVDRLRSNSSASNLDNMQRDVFAAVAVIVGNGVRGARLLFIQRAEFPGDPWSGDVAFPGGKRDARDASFLDTALREVREEVGVRLEPGMSIGRLPDMQAQSSGVRIARFAFALSADVVLVPNAEVREAFWIDLASLASPDDEGLLTRERLGLRGEYRYIAVQDRRIWGLTLRMVQDLLALLESNPAR